MTDAKQFTPITTANGNGTAFEHGFAVPAPTEDTNVSIVTDDTAHSDTQLTGDTVKYTASQSDNTTVSGSWPAAEDEHVREIVAGAIAAREARENKRANHRNFNRMLTLVFTLCAGLLITYGLYHSWFGAWGPAVGPYSFVITVAGDTILTAYALIRHY